MTRIVAGRAKGRKLAVPKEGTRPTSAKVREAIFSKLDSWKLLQDSRVLDLFAGSGALGLEAYSRGAASVHLVENSRRAQQVIQQNAYGVAGQDRSVKLFRMTASAFLSSEEGPYDVVFVDPPYDWDSAALTALLSQLVSHLSADGIVIVERDSRTPGPDAPKGLVLEEQRRWGDTSVWMYGLSDPGATSGGAPELWDN